MSGIDYYKGVNERFAELVPRDEAKGNLMAPNPLVVLCSVDCDQYAQMLVAKQWTRVCEYLALHTRRARA